MQSVRTALWVAMAVLLTLFAVSNATDAKVAIFPGYVAETTLSVVIIFSFLLGFLPPYLVNLGNRWRLQRRIKQQDETIAMLRPAPAPAPPAVPAAPVVVSSEDATP